MLVNTLKLSLYWLNTRRMEQSHPVLSLYLHLLKKWFNLELKTFHMYESWYNWMESEFKYCMKNQEFLELYHDIELFSNDCVTPYILRKPYRNQTFMVIGCGHNFFDSHKEHKDHFTVDCGLEISPDLLCLVGTVSISNCISDAKGKFETILIEGILLPETKILYDDFLFFLEDGGTVETGSIENNNFCPILKKIDDELYVACCLPNLVQWTPWTNNPLECGFGHDIFGWEKQLKRIENRKKNSTTPDKISRIPFDPEFGQ